MTITLRSQVSVPLTWAQLDENFKTVGQIEESVSKQYKDIQGYAETIQAQITDANQVADEIRSQQAAADQAAQTANQAATTATNQAQAAIEAGNKAQSYALAAVYKTVLGNAGATANISLSGPTVTYMTLVEDLTQINFSGTVPDGETRQFTLILGQGVGARKAAFDSRIDWSYGRAPELSIDPGMRDVITLIAVGGIPRLMGFFNGGAFA